MEGISIKKAREKLNVVVNRRLKFWRELGPANLTSAEQLISSWKMQQMKTQLENLKLEVSMIKSKDLANLDVKLSFMENKYNK